MMLNIKALSPVISDKKIFLHLPYISLCKTCDPRGGFIFGPRSQDYNLKKLGRGPLGDATYQYQGYRPFGFRQEDFFTFSLYKPICKTCDPQGQAIFGPRALI